VILIDSETTGLKEVSTVPADQQPRIIDFAALKLNDKTLKEEGALSFLIHPGKGISLSDEIVKITGITDAMLKGQPPFAGRYQAIVDFFLGEVLLGAHNLPFDRDVLALDLGRIGKLLQFPWPPKHFCTAELTQDITGKYLKQQDLYQHYLRKAANQTHRALDDVRQLAEIVRCMRKDGGRI
jgi:DNA polymerase III epsilon subunit-like protein